MGADTWNNGSLPFKHKYMQNVNVKLYNPERITSPWIHLQLALKKLELLGQLCTCYVMYQGGAVWVTSVPSARVTALSPGTIGSPRRVNTGITQKQLHRKEHRDKGCLNRKGAESHKGDKGCLNRKNAERHKMSQKGQILMTSLKGC